MSGQPTYQYVVNGAKIECSAGTSKGTLSLPVSHGFDIGENGLLNMNDNIPLTNVGSMGNCKNIPNMPPCVPLTNIPWLKGNDKLLIDGATALTISSKLTCAKGGIISIVRDGHGQ